MASFEETHAPNERCSQCGYDLAGLSKGGRCPECGTPSKGPSTARFVENLCDAPASYLRSLLGGFLLMSLGTLLIGGALGYLGYYGIFVAGTLLAIPNIQHYIAAACMAGALCWCVGVWLGLAERPRSERTSRDFILDNPRLRRVALLSQFSLPSAVLLLWTLGFITPGIVGWVIVGLALLALIGAAFSMVPLSVYLSSLADWAGDNVLANRLRGAAWVIAVIGTTGVLCVLGALIPHPFAGFMNVIAVYSLLLSALAIGFIALGAIRLAITVQWAKMNSLSAAARDRRLLERMLQDRAHTDRAATNTACDLNTCRACGLDLTNLGRSGRCPECNTVFVKEETPWSADDHSQDIPIESTDAAQLAGGPGAFTSPPPAPSITHFARAISKGRVRYRSPEEIELSRQLAPDVRTSRVEQAPALPDSPADSMDDTLDQLPEDPPTG